MFLETKVNQAPVAVITPPVLTIKEDTAGILDGAGMSNNDPVLVQHGSSDSNSSLRMFTSAICGCTLLTRKQIRRILRNLITSF